MNAEHLEQIRACCRDEAAFADVQAILAQYPSYCLRQDMVFHVISQIRDSLDLTTIFTKTAQSVRSLLQADRVGVFAFDPDSQYTRGEFVSEDVNPAYSSAIAQPVEDHCFGGNFAAGYQQGRYQAVTDVYGEHLSPCHVSILEQFQVRANLVIPLLQGQYLWGLLCIHQCDAPRQWDATEIQFVQQIAGQLSVAIQQAELLKTTQTQKVELEQAIQQLRQTQMHLIQSEKMSGLGQLVAGIAHEINNPISFIYGNLNHIGGYCQDLLSVLNLYQIHDPTPPQIIRDQLEEMDWEFVQQDLPNTLRSVASGAQRIQQIVLSLRNFARLDEAAMKPVDLHEGLENTLMILQHRLEEASPAAAIALEKSYSKLPLVECYASQMNQVFMNLLVNAIDALTLRRSSVPPAESPCITICTEYHLATCDRPAIVSIEIKDNGVGIPAELSSRVYDPFFTTKPAGQGTGLGLSLSYQIVVNQHHGTLKHQPCQPQGTCFRIEIPVRPVSTAVPPRQVSLASLAPASLAQP